MRIFENIKYIFLRISWKYKKAIFFNVLISVQTFQISNYIFIANEATIIINRETNLHNKAAAHVDFSMHTIAPYGKKNLFISHRITISSFLVLHWSSIPTKNKSLICEVKFNILPLDSIHWHKPSFFFEIDLTTKN